MSTYNKAALLGGNKVIVSPNTEANRQYATKQILKKLHLSKKQFNKAVKAMSYMPKRASDTPKRKRTKHQKDIPKKYLWENGNVKSIFKIKRTKKAKAVPVATVAPKRAKTKRKVFLLPPPPMPRTHKRPVRYIEQF